jgi:regulator of replication initiation timing
MSKAAGETNYATSESGRTSELTQLEAEIKKLIARKASVKTETMEMTESNRQLAAENRLLQKVVSAVNERDYSSMKHETGVLERAQNANQRDTNILENQLKKLHRSCQQTDMEFNAILTAIGHFTAENDKLEALVQHERSVLTPAAMQEAFEIIQKSVSDKLAVISPEYVKRKGKKKKGILSASNKMNDTNNAQM